MSFHSQTSATAVDGSKNRGIVHCFPELGNGSDIEFKTLKSGARVFRPIHFGKLEPPKPPAPASSPKASQAPLPAESAAPKPGDSQPPVIDAAAIAAEKENMLREIQARAQETEKQAYHAGFGQGQQQGIETGIRQLEPVLQNFRQALQELDKLRLEIYRKAEHETVDLALAIARKIICREITTDKKIVLNVIKEALTQAAGRETIRIKINPADLEVIKAHDIELSRYFQVDDAIRFEPDHSISSGGCVIETDLGEIDARIEKQLQIVEAAFRQEMLESVLMHA